MDSLNGMIDTYVAFFDWVSHYAFFAILIITFLATFVVHNMSKKKMV